MVSNLTKHTSTELLITRLCRKNLLKVEEHWHKFNFEEAYLIHCGTIVPRTHLMLAVKVFLFLAEVFNQIWDNRRVVNDMGL